MKLRQTLKSIPKKKRVSLSAMLNSEYFFHRSIQIQMALNQDRILPRDFLIKKAKPKINTGKKRIINKNQNEEELDSSFEGIREKDKKEIPDELENILKENEKKFDLQNKKYKSLKEYNDVISSYWHYINKKTKKEEREILFKRYFSNNNKNAINLYSEHLQKYCLNIFKSNPLLIRKKNAEMFFHYLSEFNKYYIDEKKFLYIKQKIVSFLEKLRDFLEYVKIKSDSGMDSISKDIKIKNSKFVKEMEIKVQQELQNIKEKQILQNEKDINECEKMIKKTKQTLHALFENKNIFEDQSYFDPTYNKKFIIKPQRLEYKNKNRYSSSAPNIIKDNTNNYSPNKNVKMSTVSTGFFIPDKNKNSNKKQDEKFIKDSNEDSKTKFEKIKLKIKKNSLLPKRGRAASSIFHFGKKNNNLYDIIKKEKTPIIKKDLNNNNDKNIEVEKNSLRESLSSSILNDYENKKKKIQNGRSNNNINSIGSNKISEEENLAKVLSDKSSIKIFNFQKKSRNSSLSINKDSKDRSNYKKKIPVFKDSEQKIQKIIKSKSYLNLINEDKKERNAIDSYFTINKSQSYNYLYGLDPLTQLYEGIKDKQKIRQSDFDKIKIYLKKTHKIVNKNLKSMDIIRQAKRITDRMDIERKTKKVFQEHLTYEQQQKLDNVKEVNKKLYKLDVDYMNYIFDYKSKNSDSILLYNNNN